MINNPEKIVMRMSSRHQQKGAVLIISLMLMMVLTILGLSGLSGASLEERMAHNFQQSIVAFQSAESAIARTVIAGNPDDKIFYISDYDPIEAARQAGVNSVIDYDNPDSYESDTSITVVYKGGGNRCVGFSYELSCSKFDITVASTIAATSTNTTHVQTVERIGPGGSGP